LDACDELQYSFTILTSFVIVVDVHTFDFLAQNWSLLMTDGVPPLPRDSHVSVVYKNSMYVFGGEANLCREWILHCQYIPNLTRRNASLRKVQPARQ
jgi:hypothetical protein